MRTGGGGVGEGGVCMIIISCREQAGGMEAERGCERDGESDSEGRTVKVERR